MSVRRIAPLGVAWAAGLLLLGALALFAQAMAPQFLAGAAFGPICSAHRAALHCPTCYLAVALVLAALAVFFTRDSAIARRRAVAAQ